MIVLTSHRVCTMKNIDFTDFFNVFLSGATLGDGPFFVENAPIPGNGRKFVTKGALTAVLGKTIISGVH